MFNGGGGRDCVTEGVDEVGEQDGHHVAARLQVPNISGPFQASDFLILRSLPTSDFLISGTFQTSDS